MSHGGSGMDHPAHPNVWELLVRQRCSVPTRSFASRATGAGHQLAQQVLAQAAGAAAERKAAASRAEHAARAELIARARSPR